jgi:methionyl-tRNA synthetase
VAELLLRCGEAGDIYKADYSGYYCVDCEEYKVVMSIFCS